MSEEIKVVNCPNCGASATNLQNCEYCGSLFVRYVDNNISIVNDITEIEKEILLGLEEALNLNIQYQKEYDCDYFETGVFISKESWENMDDSILMITNSDFSWDTEQGKRGEISIDMNMSIGNDVQKCKQEKERFLRMEEFKFFKDVNNEGWFFKMNFGTDVKGAAFLISKILKEVYNINKDSNELFYLTTIDCIVDGSVEDYNRWFEKQPLEIRRQIRIRKEEQQQEEESSGFCFIATATMGSYEHPQVMELRDFRDNWILTKAWGEKFVEWYYHYGAKIAKVIDKSYILKKLSYLLVVKPLVYISRIIKK